MKINWGTGIALFYITFVVALVYQVYKSTQYDHSLVSDEYYAEDLQYQKHYAKLVNSQQLEEDLQIIQEKAQESVKLQFPTELQDISGEIYFFCPSSSSSDFKLSIQTDSQNQQLVSTKELRRGLWRVKVDWGAAGKSFYKEEVITF